MTLKSSEVEKALLAKGFSKQNNDHKYYWYYVDGAITSIHTKMSHGMREIDSKLIGKMARQTRLKKDDFVALVSCTLTAGDYLQRMESEGQVKRRQLKTDGGLQS